MKYITTVEGKEYVIEIDREDEITVNGERYPVDIQALAEGGMISLLLNNESVEAVVEERDEHWEVLVYGELYPVQVQDEWAYLMAQAREAVGGISSEAEITAPMPGIIVATPLAPGDLVAEGDTVIILESMKMENELRSPQDGVISRVVVEPGVAVEKNQLLVVISPPDQEQEVE
jgi:biotin carboxyl carrier protein